MGELSPQASAGLAIVAGLGLVALALVFAFVGVSRLSRKQKKLLLKRRLRHAWRWLEEHGLVEKNPALIRDYHRHYPALALLERNFAVIQKECLELMAQHEKIPHIREAGGRYTTRGIHEIEWKTFILKSGSFLEANCRRAPETTRLLREIPDVVTAFFSILGPRQHIRAHWGYYKGFWRYHLGVVHGGKHGHDQRHGRQRRHERARRQERCRDEHGQCGQRRRVVPQRNHAGIVARRP